jgi:hypothetical protein
VSARVKNAATVNIWQKQPDGLSSDQQIDESLWGSAAPFLKHAPRGSGRALATHPAPVQGYAHSRGS